MKTRHIAILAASVILIAVLIAPQHAYANTCTVKLTDYATPQFFLLSDIVFAGTVQHIDNTTDHQWKVVFTVDKLWKGTVGQKPLIVMTNTLQGCGYAITSGEKYLVYTNGYPPYLNPILSKAYTDAKSDITLLDDPKFQSDEKIKEELYKKLVNAKDGLSNLMGSRMSKIPISFVGINDLNLTLDVGIADKKAALPLGAQEYEQKLEKIIGDIPMTVQYSDYASALPEIISAHTKPLPPPLKQFKFGMESNTVQCISDLKLLIKSENDHPACVKSSSVDRLLTQGWKLPENTSFQNLQTQFQSKLITKENAIAIVQEYVKEQNKTSVMNYSNSEIQANLVYYITTSFPRVPVDYSTGIPTQVMDWLDGYYKNQHWWAELEKDYLGFPSQRIEAGHIVWELDYRSYDNGIANNPIIFIDAITGKIIDTKWLY